jgi:hypothetical protein
MSEPRLPLRADQLAQLRRASQERENRIFASMLQVPDYPPLPACPECGGSPTCIESMMVEPSAFGVDEFAILINFTPCGHRFRAVPDLDGAEGWQS